MFKILFISLFWTSLVLAQYGTYNSGLSKSALSQNWQNDIADSLAATDHVWNTWVQGQIGIRDNVLYVGANAQYTTIASALSAATSGSIIKIFPGTYTENVTISIDSISLVGSGIYKTCINGQVYFSGRQGITISDMTIYGTQSGAQLQGGGATVTTDLHHTLRNLSVRAGGTGVSDHAILMQGGKNVLIENVKVSNAIHGLALRLGDAQISHITTDNCNNGITIKSATTDTNYSNVTIDNIYIKSGGGILINADDGKALNGITINNIVFDSCTYATQIQTYDAINSGSVNNVSISNVSGHYCSGALISNQSGVNVLINNVSADTVGTYGVWITDQGVDPVTKITNLNITAYGTREIQGPHEPYDEYIFLAKDMNICRGWYTTNVATLDTITNTQYHVIVQKFDDTYKRYAGIRFRAPKASSSYMYVEFGWFSEAATSGDVVWSVLYSPVGEGDAIFAGGGGGAATATGTTNSTALTLNKTTVWANASYLTEGDWVFVHLSRVGDDAADTMVGDACLVYVRIYY